ncbi:LuxR C-terminal-related transcriptional regulator [Sabulilitoribacter multivorans]|uniref:LuxR C-terminal-related transcriptional regulator n=1 Tax=Flaviramulus multivorans TaxID=1304750 RepID=A0ABS9ILZ1_9FLAO|nr:triple tyrosine motif-containing protein [Flaviramulus multivorans]MCF7561626.1 LuxR C-terminal-related transcriptional regulator [Flaviramulus multivorans]
MNSKRFILLITIFCAILIFQAQERPPIQVYSPNDYGADNQNWSISQSDENTIYVANNKGLLEFNGAKWTVYPSPNKTIIRSVKVIDGFIYTGCYREFGYWSRNESGALIYYSLSDKLNISFLEDEELWNIVAIDDWILFQSLNRIYIYNKRSENYSIIDSESTIYKMFKVNEGVYFQKVNDGVYEIINGKAKLVSDDILLKENLLANIFNYYGKLLFLTEDNGFFILDNNDLKKWNISADDELEKLRIYSSLRLKDNSFLLGTISDGILLLSSDGDIKHKLNQSTGLSNNTTLSVFEDIENNLWLGLENGINCINIKSPLSIYNDEEGRIGAVNASALYKGNLYIGTNQGLFYKEYNTNKPFNFIKGTQGAVWFLSVINGTLFCGHNSGTYVVTDDRADLISNIQGTWNIKSIGNTELLLQGNYTGLYVLEIVDGTWKVRNKIKGFDISSRHFDLYSKNFVFVSHEYKGVFKITLNDELTEAINIEKVTSVEKGIHTSLVKYEGDILYSHRNGIFKYNATDDDFIRDSIYSRLFDKHEYTSGKLIVDNSTNKLWALSHHGLSYLTPRKLTNIPKIDRIPIPFSSRNDVLGYENITHLEDNKFLYGNSKGYIIFDINKIKPKPFLVSINLITKSKFKNKDSIILLNKSIKSELKYTENNVEFNFSVPNYNKFLEPEYQYKLEGIYNHWSKWSTKSNELFENLPHGDYTFKVRARLGDTISDNIESYNFRIERPWFISNKMLVVYVALVLLFSLFMHNIYKRYYRKQQEKLLQKKQSQLELKELENKEQLARFNNEKLREDIENKNRELATSTMSLIKKNEFLNSIKSELKNVKDNRDISKVIKIIDKNINNNDDWHLFEEAFNNADKDFLKKIKSLHPELTSNDLRLCAYLRLNLSSKEIAPLLNISPRSVEVKRYRLRKKMNLEHESSLTDYILEI